MRETQERIGLLKEDSDTRFNLETEFRMKDFDSIRKDVHKLLDRLSALDDEAINEKKKHGKLETELMTLQGTVAQVLDYVSLPFKHRKVLFSIFFSTCCN